MTLGPAAGAGGSAHGARRSKEYHLSPSLWGCIRNLQAAEREKKCPYQNRVSIVGFVGNDGQLRSTKNGTTVAVFSVATESSWKNATSTRATNRLGHSPKPGIIDGTLLAKVDADAGQDRAEKKCRIGPSMDLLATAQAAASAAESMKARSSGILFLVAIILLTQPSFAQTLAPKPAPGAEENKPAEKPIEDPLGRSTPYGAVHGFLNAAENRDYERAAEYLDSKQPPGQNRNSRASSRSSWTAGWR
jgi:hypothetical protein